MMQKLVSIEQLIVEVTVHCKFFPHKISEYVLDPLSDPVK